MKKYCPTSSRKWKNWCLESVKRPSCSRSQTPQQLRSRMKYVFILLFFWLGFEIFILQPKFTLLCRTIYFQIVQYRVHYMGNYTSVSLHNVQLFKNIFCRFRQTVVEPDCSPFGSMAMDLEPLWFPSSTRCNICLDS